MKFHPTRLRDACIVELEPRGDERGFFARLLCRDEFSKAGLVHDIAQVNNSLSEKKGTLRGLHYQLPPHSEMKLVRCIRGALWDTILDLRPDSPTFCQWFGAELNEGNRLMMYVPPGFAHAILTLADRTETIYFVSTSYAASAERGVRWNDPRFRIEWPIEPAELSGKDATWPDFDPEYHGIEQFRRR